ncbi:MAG: hypothetical protein L0I29_00615 [Hyphomicrobiales bacterium]|nr:hypothetical protein [Hyphomicrobiales bacterium]
MLYVLDRGEILQTGRPSDVLSAPASERVREALDLQMTDDGTSHQAPAGKFREQAS